MGIEVERRTAREPVPRRRRLLAAASYLGPLILLPLYRYKGDAFLTRHLNQGFGLLTLTVAIAALGSLVPACATVCSWVGYGLDILLLVGIAMALTASGEGIPLLEKIRIFH